MDFTYLYFLLLLLGWLLYAVTKGKLRLPVLGAYVAWGSYLIVARVLESAAYAAVGGLKTMAGIRVRLPEREPFPDRVVDYSRYWRLRGLKVVLGLKHSRAIQIDLETHHTLIGAASGGGKTNCINSILIQLFSRGVEFTENYDVYLIDLKGDPTDNLSHWRRVVTGYFGIGDGDIRAAIEALRNIVANMHRDSSGKRLLVVIDEVSVLTSSVHADRFTRSAAHNALTQLAAQIRSRGALLMSTQHVTAKIISRESSVNAARRILFRTQDLDAAKQVLGYRPKIDVRNLQPGEFIMSEPGRDDVTGRVPFVRTPQEIDEVIGRLVDIIDESDIRIRVLRASIAGIGIGKQLHGINKVAPVVEGVTNEDVKNHRRNYDRAGIVKPNYIKTGSRAGEVNSYNLVVEPEEAVMMLVRYIQAGFWEDAPAKVGEREDEN